MREVYYVGLDVHKDSIQMAVLDSRKKGPIMAKGLPNRAIRIMKELAGYQEKGRVQIAYEAGCLGYTLYRELTEFGFDCRVIPPNTVFSRWGRSGKDGLSGCGGHRVDAEAERRGEHSDTDEGRRSDAGRDPVPWGLERKPEKHETAAVEVSAEERGKL
jgi:hypothetical protein